MNTKTRNSLSLGASVPLVEQHRVVHLSSEPKALSPRSHHSIGCSTLISDVGMACNFDLTFLQACLLALALIPQSGNLRHFIREMMEESCHN